MAVSRGRGGGHRGDQIWWDHATGDDRQGQQEADRYIRDGTTVTHGVAEPVYEFRWIIRLGGKCLGLYSEQNVKREKMLGPYPSW